MPDQLNKNPSANSPIVPPAVPQGNSSDSGVAFGNAILQMMQKYQNINKTPFQQPQLNAQGQAAQGVAYTDPNLIGASPSQQAQSQNANAAGPVQAAQNYQQAGQTFSSQLQSFESLLNQANTFGKDFVTMNPGPAVIQGYLNALAAGGKFSDVPEAAKSSVFKALSANPDILTQWENHQKLQTVPFSYTNADGQVLHGSAIRDPQTGQIVIPQMTQQGKVGVGGGGVGGGGISNGTSPKTNTTGDYADFLSGRTPQQVKAFNSLPALEKSSVSQLINGDVLLADLISSRGIQGSIQRQRMLADARKIDPNFSENTNKIRYKFMQEWNDLNNKTGMTRNSINTALGHLADVKLLSQQLQSQDLQVINTTKNWWDAETGNDNVTNLQFGLTQLATEIATIYKGGSPAQEEIAAEKANLGLKFSSGQFKGLFNTISQFLSSKITASRYQYKSTMGKEYSQSIIDPEKRQALVDAGIDPNSIVKENVKKTNQGSGDTQKTQDDGTVWQQNADGSYTRIK